MALLVQRSTPTVKAKYGDYKDDLRYDFYYSCAYCSLSEVEAACISFEIDHYKPQATADPDVDAYANLLWSCDQCNGYKSDFWPTEHQAAQGHRIVRPDQDDLVDHYELDGHDLAAKSTPGDATITILRLNRSVLRKLREARYRLHSAQQGVMSGLQALNGISLDLFSPDFRAKVNAIKQDVHAQDAALIDALNALMIRALNRSPHADPDPSKDEHTRARREYLKKVKALVP